MKDFGEALRFLHKVKRIYPLQKEYEDKVIAKAIAVESEIRELRREAEKPFPVSEDRKCTDLERKLVEKMGEYRKMCQLEELAKFDYKLGNITGKELEKIGCDASYLLQEANEIADMLLKERYVVVFD